jgi:outer membrane receptor protein involved in Fe transport
MPESYGRLSARADYYYQSKTAYNVNNTPNGNPLNDAASVGGIIDSYSLLNLRLDWSNVLQSAFSVGIYATNVTDEKYVVGHSNLLAGPTFTGSYSYGAPRMIGVEGRLEF